MNNADADKCRILLLIDSLNSGGAQRQLCYLASGLKGLGYSVEVAVYHPQYDYFKPTLRQQQIQLHELAKSSAGGMIRQLGNVIRENRIDWVIAFLEGASYYALLTKLRYRNVRVCIAERSAYTGSLTLRRRILRQLYRMADVVTTNSHAQANLLREQYPGLAQRICTVHNCIDEALFLEGGQALAAESASESWDHERDWMVVLAQVAPWKNLHGLIDACAIYRDAFGSPPRIRWAGREAEAHADYVAAQKGRIRQLGLHDTIELLGVVQDVPGLLKQARGLLHPSLREGFPNAVCEAFAIGLPVVIGDISDARMLVEQQRGLLFDPTQPQSIAEALHTFVTLPASRRRAMGAAAKSFAKAELKQVDVARKYAAILETNARHEPSSVAH